MVRKWMLCAGMSWWALSGCTPPERLDNGAWLSGIELSAGKPRRFSIEMPSTEGTIALEASSHSGVSVRLLSPTGVSLRECQGGTPCVSRTEGSGRYIVELLSTQGGKGISLSGAWVTGDGQVSLDEGQALLLPALPPGGSSLQSLVVPAGTDLLSLDIGSPDSGTASIDLIDASGGLVQGCQTGIRCSLSTPLPGAHFLRHHSPAGASSLSVTRVPTLIDLQGVWVVSQSTVKWSFFKDLLLACVDSLIAFISDPYAAANAFRIEVPEILAQWRDQITRDNRRLINMVLQLMNQLYVSSIGDIYQIRAKLASLPETLKTDPLPACEAARSVSGYFEFSHQNGLYHVTHGATGEGVARETAGCEWMATPEDEYVIPGQTTRQVSGQYLERFLELDEGEVTVSLDGHDSFSITLDSGLVPGSIAVLSRLICAAANLPDSMFDAVRAFEGGLTLKASVPDPGGSKSGVTVSAGFDLGARNEQDLLNLGFPDALITLLRPYLGLQKYAALNFLRQNPLTITTEDAELIHEKSRLQSLSRLVADYAKDSRRDFCSIPQRWQTVISSIQFQYGSARTKTPTFWKAVAEQRWADAIAQLRDFKDNYPTRRNLEADYVQSLQ